MSWRALCLMSALTIASFDSTASAEHPEDTPDCKEQYRWYRELNGHFFIPSLTVDDPFVATFFKLQSGAGIAWVQGPSFDPRGNPIGNDSYTGATLFSAASLQVHLLRWLALRVGGISGLVGGFNLKSALVLGATIPLHAQAGVTASWQIGKYTRLGALFDFDYQHSVVIQPLASVQRSLEVGQADASKARQKADLYSVVPGVSAAFAPHPAIGLVGTAQYLWLRRDDGASTLDVHNLVFGVVAQLDLKPLIAKVPIGILGAYRAQIPINSNESVSHDVEGGLYYTGRRALVLGLTTQGRWFEVRPGFEAKALIISTVIRYYWN
jgi:hypothetical protein